MSTRSWPNQHSDADAARYRAAGLWRDRTIAAALADLSRAEPDRIAIVDAAGRYSYGDLEAKARRLSGWFLSQGLQPGDVVAFQLPNWHEAVVIALSTSMLGLVCLPIVPIYREAEVRFILEASGAKLFLTPDSFRGFDHGALADRLAAEIPTLDAAVRIRGADGPDPLAAEPYEGAPQGTATEPWLLMYTSGTTGHPKGVIHCANSLDCELVNVTGWWDLRADRDVSLMPSPVTHVTGFLYGVIMPFSHGIPAVLMERWDTAEALRLIAAERASFMVSATPFLRELIDTASANGDALETLRVFACGGAPVPPDLIRQAWERFPGLLACRVYGSTEAPTVTLGVRSRDNLADAAETDGHIVGHDVRIVADDGSMLPAGEDGEIRTRGPEMFSGYLDPDDHAAAFDEDGYFRTGDLGHVTPDGYVTVTGRKKDLIIRGGENLSAKEIEDALFRHPAIREVAVVAMPHPRLGETCCAYLVTDGRAPDVAELSAFLSAQGLARQKHPEKVVVTQILPRTASGKIQKFVLREQLSKNAAQ